MEEKEYEVVWVLLFSKPPQILWLIWGYLGKTYMK